MTPATLRNYTAKDLAQMAKEQGKDEPEGRLNWGILLFILAVTFLLLCVVLLAARHAHEQLLVAAAGPAEEAERLHRDG